MFLKTVLLNLKNNWWCIWNISTVVDPTIDRTISFPNQTGLVGLIGGVKTPTDDIVLDGTDSSSTDDGSRLLLEDVMDGDTGSF